MRIVNYNKDEYKHVDYLYLLNFTGCQIEVAHQRYHAYNPYLYESGVIHSNANGIFWAKVPFNDEKEQRIKELLDKQNKLNVLEFFCKKGRVRVKKHDAYYTKDYLDFKNNWSVLESIKIRPGYTLSSSINGALISHLIRKEYQEAYDLISKFNNGWDKYKIHYYLNRLLKDYFKNINKIYSKKEKIKNLEAQPMKRNNRPENWGNYKRNKKKGKKPVLTVSQFIEPKKRGQPKKHFIICYKGDNGVSNHSTFNSYKELWGYVKHYKIPFELINWIRVKYENNWGENNDPIKLTRYKYNKYTKESIFKKIDGEIPNFSKTRVKDPIKKSNQRYISCKNIESGQVKRIPKFMFLQLRERDINWVYMSKEDWKDFKHQELIKRQGQIKKEIKRLREEDKELQKALEAIKTDFKERRRLKAITSPKIKKRSKTISEERKNKTKKFVERKNKKKELRKSYHNPTLYVHRKESTPFYTDSEIKNKESIRQKNEGKRLKIKQIFENKRKQLKFYLQKREFKGSMKKRFKMIRERYNTIKNKE